MSNASTPVKIHGLHQSTCTQRVKVIAYEKGVDVQVDPVNFAAAEHKSPAHLEYQPFGQIPYLDDDGFVLFESRAIGRYIAAKYANQGTKLLPSASDLKAVAIFEQGASIELAGFEPCAGGIYLQKIVIPFKGGKTDEAKLKEHHDTLKTKLQGYERMLAKHKYLAGDVRDQRCRPVPFASRGEGGSCLPWLLRRFKPT